MNYKLQNINGKNLNVLEDKRSQFVSKLILYDNIVPIRNRY